MRHKTKQCIDAGTQNCPCQLSQCRDCLVCSRLAGAGCCDCDWQGVCIYNEYFQNNCRLHEQRSSSIHKVQKKIWYDKDLAVMRVEVPRGFAENASLPGSCVFVKKPGMEAFFDTPISVLRTDFEEGTMDLAVKVLGPKSKNLLSDVGGPMVEMRGVYRNGLLGARKLMTAAPKRVLCLTKGIGLAPIINYSRWAGGKDHIDLVADTDKVGRRFAEECLLGCQVNSVEYRRLPLDLSQYRPESYDLIVLSASDYYQQNIYIPEDKRVISNNNSMCCGEGICGACIFTDKNGTAHRMCKCSKMDV